MIDGVYIISQTGQTAPNIWILVIYMILLVAFMVSMAIFDLSRKTYSDKRTALLMLLCVVVAAITLPIACYASTHFGTPTGCYEYKARIDGNVTVEELIDKYDIVSVDDDVFTLRDKEN